MKKTHQWMLFFLFMTVACTKKAEKFVFYQTTEAKETFQQAFLFEESSKEVESAVQKTTKPAESIAVYLCGEVVNPGVYVLEAGSRLYQAVEMAGGLTERAKPASVNLARILVDSEQIFIPDVSETDWQQSSQPLDENQPISQTGAAQININQASLSELMGLPGIGQVKAEAIITYRESNGPFASIEEIKNVPGIKEAAFEKIKGMITVF